MSTYSESAFPDDVEFELEDDLPRGPRPLALSRRVTFAIALVLALALAGGAAAMAFNVGKATQSEPAAKVDVAQQVADANAAGVAAGTKAGLRQRLRGRAREGHERVVREGVQPRLRARQEARHRRGPARRPPRAGFSDGADSVSGKYQKAITDLTTAARAGQEGPRSGREGR